MNQKLKDLIEQAGTDVSGKWLSLYNVETLAQLIVKECVAICEDTDGEHIVDAKWGRQCCALEIKQYFGVEE
jgi:hypothetical protein